MTDTRILVILAAFLSFLLASAPPAPAQEIVRQLTLEDINVADLYISSRIGDGLVRLGHWGHQFVAAAFIKGPFVNKSFHLVKNTNPMGQEYRNVFEMHVSFKEQNKMAIFNDLVSFFLGGGNFKHADKMLGISYDSIEFPGVFIMRFMEHDLFQEISTFLGTSLEGKDATTTGFKLDNFSHTSIGISAEPDLGPRYTVFFEGRDIKVEYTLKEAFEYVYLLKEFGGVGLLDIVKIGYVHGEDHVSEFAITFPALTYVGQSQLISQLLTSFAHECFLGKYPKHFSKIVSFNVENVIGKTSQTLRLVFRYPGTMDVPNLTSTLTYMVYMSLAELLLDTPKNTTKFLPATFSIEGHPGTPCPNALDLSRKVVQYLKSGIKKPVVLKFAAKPNDEPVRNLVLLKSSFKLTKDVDFGRVLTSIYELIGTPENKKLQDTMLQEFRFFPTGIADHFTVQLSFANRKGDIGHAMGIFYMILQACRIEEMPTVRVLNSMKPGTRETMFKLESPIESELSKKKADIKFRKIGRASSPIASNQTAVSSDVESGKPEEITSEKPAKGLSKSVMSKKQAKRLRNRNKPLVRVPVDLMSLEQDMAMSADVKDIQPASPTEQVDENESGETSDSDEETDMPKKKRKVRNCTKARRAAREKARLEKEKEATSSAADSTGLPNEKDLVTAATDEPVLVLYQVVEEPIEEPNAEEHVKDEHKEDAVIFANREVEIFHEDEVAVIINDQEDRADEAMIMELKEKIIVEEASQVIANVLNEIEAVKDVEPTVKEQALVFRNRSKSWQSLSCSKQFGCDLPTKKPPHEELDLATYEASRLDKGQPVLAKREEKVKLDAPTVDNQKSSPCEVDPVMPQSKIKSDPNVPQNTVHSGTIKNTIFGPVIRTERQPDAYEAAGDYYSSPLVVITPSDTELTFAQLAGSWDSVNHGAVWSNTALLQDMTAIHVIRKKLFTRPAPPKSDGLVSLIIEIPGKFDTNILQMAMKWVEIDPKDLVRHRTLSVSLVDGSTNLIKHENSIESFYLVFTLRYPQDDIDDWLKACAHIVGKDGLQNKTITGEFFAPTKLSDLIEEQFTPLTSAYMTYPSHYITELLVPQLRTHSTRVAFKNHILNLSYAISGQCLIPKHMNSVNLVATVSEVMSLLPLTYIQSGYELTISKYRADVNDIDYLEAIVPESENTLANALNIFETILGAKEYPLVSLVLSSNGMDVAFKFGFGTSLDLADIHTMKKLTSSICRDIKWAVVI